MTRVPALLGLLWCATASGQEYIVSTIAGGAPPVTPASATAVSIGDPPRVAADSQGNVYFGSLHSVFKVDPTGILTRIAGSGRAGNSGDGGPATSAQLQDPDGIAIDPAGNIYVADRAAQVIRKISASGVISTLAGSGTAGFFGDGGQAVKAQLNNPSGLAVDQAGNLYVADSGNNCVRVISASGTIGTFAGNSSLGPAYGGDGGPAADAALNGPTGVAVDASGNLYIADTYNNRVRKVAPDGTITTAAGTGTPGFSGNNQPVATSALFLPTAVAVDTSGNLYVADLGNSLIRMVASGNVKTVAGNPTGVPPSDGLTAVSVRLSGPTGVAVDPGGNVFFAEGSIGSGSGLAGGVFRIWKVTADGLFFAWAGNGQNSFSGDGGPASVAQTNAPSGVALDSSGNLYVADYLNHRVRKITPAGLITTIAGTGVAGFSGDGGPAVNAQLNGPLGVAADAFGNVFIADSGNNRIREVLADGTIGTYAGNGNAGFFGDGGSALQAAMHSPSALTLDASDNLFVADTLDFRVRKIDVFNIITTVAGNGLQGSAGDGGLASSASLNAPTGVAVDGAGDIFIADAGAGQVRKVAPNGAISTVVGGGPSPRGVAVDAAGNLYIADDAHNQVRQISEGGIVTTISGTGACCYSGDGGPAVLAQWNQPRGLVVDPTGNVYVADAGNNAIRLLRPGITAPVVTTVANGASNLSGAVAPGEIVVIFGSGIGPAQLTQYQAIGGLVPTQLAGTSILFNGKPGPVLYTSGTQVSAIVPYGVSGASVQIVAQYQTASSPPVTVPLASAAPALFTLIPTGSGQAAAVNADGSLNSASHPAPVGSTITLYATGEGQTSPAGVDGKVASSPAPSPLLGVQVMIGGQPATVISAGGALGFPAGMMQVTAVVPGGIHSGAAVPVVLLVGGVPSPSGVTITGQ